jgi:hypothetical protein
MQLCLLFCFFNILLSVGGAGGGRGIYYVRRSMVPLGNYPLVTYSDVSHVVNRLQRQLHACGNVNLDCFQSVHFSSWPWSGSMSQVRFGPSGLPGILII